MLVLLGFLTAAVFGFNEGAGDELDFCRLVKQLYDLDSLPYLSEGMSSDQASSYDRRSRYDPTQNQYLEWNANHDRGHQP